MDCNSTEPGAEESPAVQRSNLSKTCAYDVVVHITSSREEPRTTSCPFTSGNPSVEIIDGRLKLFRDPESDMISEGEVGPSDTCCVLEVPAYLSTADLVRSCTKTSAEVHSIRLLRDGLVADRRMALVKLGSRADARVFHNDTNGTPYTSMEARDGDVCRTLFVQSVTFTDADVPQQEQEPIEQCTPKEESAVQQDRHVELPTCIVCLERLDYSITGRTELTTLCNHTFHRECLEQSMSRGNRNCPVCRYCTDGGPADSSCQECGSNTSLWICLICGFMGCGRYDNAHARMHYESTKHAYALDPESQRVWDYAGDGYVHRLIQNMVDGKLVELPDVGSQSDSRVDGEHDTIDKSMLEELMCHYEQELMRHLETQKRYFEEELRKASSTSVDAAHQLQSFEKKYKQLQKKFDALQKENDELNEMNQMHRENQEKWQQQLTKHMAQTKLKNQAQEERIAELEALNHDLMTSMETQSRIAEVGGTGGLMVLTDSPDEPSGGRSRKQNKR